MSEKMNGKNPNNGPPTGLTYQQLKAALEAQNQNQASARPMYASRPVRYAQPAQPTQPRVPEMRAQPELGKKHKRSRKAIAALSISAVVVVGTGAAYTFNVGGLQDTAQHFLGGSGADSASANGLTMSPELTAGEKSLSIDQCDLPEAMFLVATVNADIPLVPVLPVTSPETGKSVVAKLDPYMAKPGDGYNHVAAVNLPLALEICEPVGGISNKNGVYTIDRSKLRVTFQDPIGLTGATINPKYQNKGEKSVKLDASKGEYLTLPQSLYINTDTDPILKQSVADLTKSLQDPAQLKLLLALIETGAVQDLDSVVQTQSEIKYPDANDKVLQDVIDKLLMKRLGGNLAKTTFKNNYYPQMDVPRDPKTKQPITAAAATTLKYLDATKPVHVSSIDIVYGGVTAPTASPTPTPSTTSIPGPTGTTAP
jgi:hypothetical protein